MKRMFLIILLVLTGVTSAAVLFFRYSSVNCLNQEIGRAAGRSNNYPNAGNHFSSGNYPFV